MNAFVLTLIGPDRTGLVAALSAVVAQHDGSWERSHLTELSGVFAGVVEVHVPDRRSGAFQDALAPLRDQGLLDVALRPVPRPGAAAEDREPLSFQVMGSDRPGIVNEVSQILADLGVGIIDLRTHVESASMAGSPLFRASVVVTLPPGMDDGDLAGAFEDLSDDLMVDALG